MDKEGEGEGAQVCFNLHLQGLTTSVGEGLELHEHHVAQFEAGHEVSVQRVVGSSNSNNGFEEQHAESGRSCNCNIDEAQTQADNQ